ncbi:MAG TPA: Bax inhibitor-1/YccA family protein, partial [Thermoplasmata archaeon]|nr:Bax inhibitor-1/YccA family protein [Thermoplasmata archaeon]
GAIMVIYLVGLILTLFGIPVFFWSSSSPISIAFSVFVVAIAALNFVLDFAFIEEGVNNNAPKHMEWYAAFGLLVTLVWLYIEILRLLAKLRSR